MQPACAHEIFLACGGNSVCSCGVQELLQRKSKLCFETDGELHTTVLLDWRLPALTSNCCVSACNHKEANTFLPVNKFWDLGKQGSIQFDIQFMLCLYIHSNSETTALAVVVVVVIHHSCVCKHVHVPWNRDGASRTQFAAGER